MPLKWQIGVEIELLAPLGRSRLDLAQALAEQCGGRVQRFFHPQSEPSQVAGAPVFENLTLGFNVLDAQGQLVASCVDDLTLQKDLVRQRLPRSGWYRIVSDDSRLIRLIMRQADASETCPQVLAPLAELFGSELAVNADGMVRLSDDTGLSIAIAAPLPGERERPCELITAPIVAHHQQRLEELLSIARALAFYRPVEGATHIHFDASALCSAPVLANLVRVLHIHGSGLRRLVGANANCTRLGDWPVALYELVQQEGFIDLSWPQVQARLRALTLTKYCDFNLKNMVEGTPDKHTFEVRIFPVWLDALPVLEAAGLFEAILNWSIETGPAQTRVPSALSDLLKALPMSESLRDCWLKRLI